MIFDMMKIMEVVTSSNAIGYFIHTIGDTFIISLSSDSLLIF